MKAIVDKEEGNIAVEDIKAPKFENIHDAILKVTSAAICDGDLHMYDGGTNKKKGTFLDMKLWE